ncbi:MAG: hypothetical protein Q9183_001814 [Haloplaca sp. 2 TL-2023]
MDDQLAYRTQPELDALHLLRFSLGRFGVSTALDCNNFRQWLGEYPFGGDLESRYPTDEAVRLHAKQKAVHKFFSGQSKDPVMTDIVQLIEWNERGCSMMSDNRLLLERIDDFDELIRSDDDGYGHVWYEIHGSTNAPDPGLGPMMRRGQRVREESMEEQTLRSRRREAMVLGEMGRPIERENIIQRIND